MQAMKYNREGLIGNFFFSHIMHYNYEKYWKMRDCVVEDSPHTCKLIRMIYLLRIKKMEAENSASFGTAMGKGAYFASWPVLPHGLTGSFISHTAKFGNNCTIMQNVIVGSSKKEAPTIGDNVLIGAGAIVIGGITIGSNVHIGAGCVVTENIPDNCTVVMHKPRIIVRNAVEQQHEEWVF